MSSPRVSVVIPSYNYGRFVAEAIESVFAQEFPASQLEVIVVDDGSTDDTPERVRQFEGRISYIRKPNGGQASALNAGFAHARTDIVALLDADDLWLPGKLARVIAAFDEHPEAVMVQHTRLLWNVESNQVEREADFPPLSGRFPMSGTDLLQYGTMATSGIAFRKSLLGDLLPIPEVLTGHADSYLSALAALKAPVVSLNEPLTKYRIHGGNLYSFVSTDGKRAARRLQQMQTFFRELGRSMSEFGSHYSREDLSAYLSRFRLIEEDHRFSTRGATRTEFFRHLRQHRKVYGPLWTPRYRAYRVALEWLALALGYRTFTALRARTAQAGLPERREAWAPAHAAQSLTSELHKALP